MNNARASYVRFIPLVFLGGLLVMGLQMCQLYFTRKFHGNYLPLNLLMGVVKNGFVWAAIGLAFKKMKPALLAFGLFILLITVFNCCNSVACYVLKILVGRGFDPLIFML